MATKWSGVRALAIGAALFVMLLGPSGPALAAASAAGLEHFAIVPDSSTASYSVSETFFNHNNRVNEAVGTTHAIQGQIAVDRAHPAQSVVGPIRVDLSTLQSSSGKRDDMIRQHWLESAQHPTAEFDSTAIRGLPAPYPDGQEVSVQIQGTLTVREVARPVTFSGTVRLAGNTLTGTLSAVVQMTDFGFDPPSILGVLKADNQVTVTMQFVAARVQAPAQ